MALKLIANSLDLLSAHGKSIREWEAKLRIEYEKILRQYGLSMRPAKIEIKTSTAFCSSLLGQWIPSTSTIYISWKHVTDNLWSEVVSTLKHEISHQAAEELYGLQSFSEAHNETF